jgi:hypothetical protein
MLTAIESRLRVVCTSSPWRRLVAGWLFSALCMPLAVSAQSDGTRGWERCVKIEQAASRLACYDDWAGRRPAEADKKSPEAALPASSTPQFGLEDRVEAAMPATMESRISGNFEGWFPGDRIKLANGQVWQIADGSSGVIYARDPKVVIRRGALGSFRLEIDGTNRAPRVRRIE